ncbi:putative RING-H2 finger protein ATL69 [Physcomitrium patens]|uniref:RING-type domain-containing protein n=1 Tax=Physcomitrium patens TaxID=3218 RepID=A0A2K1KG85_PHYPA|nr:RING-H2 finger protein ATL67-like [Physcomitrium patens]XP_024377295.1 RING-H2 finger protein ATL67-like [Physcomitrium patens]PNR52794.1 hypothetical protein PHYPA_009169 [Physcomitrium patens]|eukprot:XP_024377294.1 RING-H2 finger protein ATL67-like [Physcomitrella patens]
MNFSNTTTMQVNLSKVGLGYGIAIAVGILVLVSTIMLASYVCVRVHQTSSGSQSGNSAGPAAYHSGGDDAHGNPLTEWSTSGLDQVTVESYPKVVYTASQPPLNLQDNSCSICLGDYKDGDILRMLPECRHMFHAPCIDAWLRLHASCPMCRTSPLPTPLTTPISTPLSELIPLARHPLQIRH